MALVSMSLKADAPVQPCGPVGCPSEACVNFRSRDDSRSIGHETVPEPLHCDLNDMAPIRMAQRDNDIYAGAHLRRLQSEASAAVLPALQRCAGAHGLLISALPHDHPPVLPLLGHWVRLRIANDSFRGDLKARADEPLPFADDAFDLVLLRHVLEFAHAPQPLLAEACRVLAPGGLLVLTGVHPLSAWAPWVYWHTRGRGKPLLRSPLTLERWVRADELDVERVIRVGHVWPNATGAHRGEHMAGGAYVLVARKQRRAMTPTRLMPKLVRAPVNVNLAPGARRHASS